MMSFFFRWQYSYSNPQTWKRLPTVFSFIWNNRCFWLLMYNDHTYVFLSYILELQLRTHSSVIFLDMLIYISSNSEKTGHFHLNIFIQETMLRRCLCHLRRVDFFLLFPPPVGVSLPTCRRRPSGTPSDPFLPIACHQGPLFQDGFHLFSLSPFAWVTVCYQNNFFFSFSQLPFTVEGISHLLN